MQAKTMIAVGHRVGLKRCPFCSAPAAADSWRGLDTGVRVGCDNADCPVQPDVTAPTLEMAAEAWNTRAGGGVRVDADVELDRAAWASATHYSYGSLARDLEHVAAFKAAVQGETPQASTAAQEGYASGLRHARRST